MACIALLFSFIQVLGRLDIIFISWALKNAEIMYVMKVLSFPFLPLLFQLFLRKLQLLDFWPWHVLQFYLDLPQW